VLQLVYDFNGANSFMLEDRVGKESINECCGAYRQEMQESDRLKSEESAIRQDDSLSIDAIHAQVSLENAFPDALYESDYAFLREKTAPDLPKGSESVKIVDLFCGCGGLSLGAKEACRATGKRFLPVLALDNDPIVVKVYDSNFRPAIACVEDIVRVIDGAVGSQPTESEYDLLKKIGKINILLAGPPCQGYSSLNNFSRQNDHRNALYERVARLVETAKPEHVLIENVPTVTRSKEMVVQKTIGLLQNLGYSVDSGIVDLSAIGVPQRRKRHVVVASVSKPMWITEVIDKHQVKHERPAMWAIGDIEDEAPTGILNTPTHHSGDNMRRIKYLQDANVYDLPNELRPRCHRVAKHGYKSMYGRMKPDEPAQTITSGFPSPGQGRFIHPTKLRTITAHEAARLQFFPDFFDFSQATTRQSLSNMIGNAAPMKLSFVFCLDLLS
jgi:DNA (cytosine-5)-methyltransferase 1